MDNNNFGQTQYGQGAGMANPNTNAQIPTNPNANTQTPTGYNANAQTPTGYNANAQAPTGYGANVQTPTNPGTNPGPITSSEPDKQAIASPKDNSTQKIVILSITTGFFAMLAIIFGIINFLPGRDSGQSGSGESGSSSSQDDSDDDYSPPINTNTVEGYQEVNSLLETLVLNVGKNSTPIATNSNVEIFYVPDGLKSHVSLRLSLARTIDSNLEKVKSNLESQGFILVGEMPHATSAPMPTAYEYVNVSKDMVCGIYSVTNEKTGEEGVYTSCGKTSWTWLTDEEKNTISELEEAYFEKNGEYPKKIDSITLKIKDSRFKPYQTAVVSTTGNSFFYRTSPNSKWQYFRTSLVAATCDEYNTDDLRKAYLGEVCYTGENNTVPSTVQL